MNMEHEITGHYSVNREGKKELEIGEETPIPTKPNTKASKPLHDYYEFYLAAILADYQESGDASTRELWGFSPSGWTAFRRRHNLPIRKYTKSVKKGNWFTRLFKGR